MLPLVSEALPAYTRSQRPPPSSRKGPPVAVPQFLARRPGGDEAQARGKEDFPRGEALSAMLNRVAMLSRVGGSGELYRSA